MFGAHISSAAAALYDGGWRVADREQLIREYHLADDGIAICQQLGEYEKRSGAEVVESYNA